MKYTLTADRFRTWLAVILVAVLALASFWILELMRRNDTDGNSRSSARSEPDYYVENFSFIRLPNNGQANYHITGDKLSHHPLNDNFEIQQPRINSFDADKVPLNIRAERAVIEQKNLQITPARENDQIHLQGDVQAERPETTSSKYMKLQSEYLLLLPNENKMKTDQAVSVYTHTSELHAIGMIADNATQQIQLLSKVRASFNKSDAAAKPKT
ncbi:MAG: LPS export ABC transporter periplasmic protein LptC [Pseudomonadota bacterium]